MDLLVFFPREARELVNAGPVGLIGLGVVLVDLPEVLLEDPEPVLVLLGSELEHVEVVGPPLLVEFPGGVTLFLLLDDSNGREAGQDG